MEGRTIADGRPKVPDELLERMKEVTLNEAVRVPVTLEDR